jgi:hypothetical protein
MDLRRREVMIVSDRLTAATAFGPSNVNVRTNRRRVRRRSAPHAMRWLPQSQVGWSAVAVAGLHVASVASILLAVVLGLVEIPDSFTDNLVFTGWGLSIWATGVACVVTGVVAITRRHERSWMVLVATFLGLLPVVMLLTEAAMGKV